MGLINLLCSCHKPGRIGQVHGSGCVAAKYFFYLIVYFAIYREMRI